jgi:protein-tyrosine phosphatase
MGNICRSPTAEGVFRALLKNHEDTALVSRFFIDSAGTTAYHVGSTPDQRSQKTARQHGVDLSSQRARQVVDEDFEAFDWILAMDSSNYADLMRQCPNHYQHKVRLFLEFNPDQSLKDVPDPYYGVGDGFERVYQLVSQASSGFLSHVLATTSS